MSAERKELPRDPWGRRAFERDYIEHELPELRRQSRKAIESIRRLAEGKGPLR